MNELVKKIQKLKEKHNAVILAHNYQPDEIQDLADYTGDSLGLSVKASETDADVIVFCGVSFMAETAAILSPQKTVLLPEKHAGCPLADMITAQQLRDFKKEHPDALVVCYVNSTADVKAESDYCCTSANAVDVVESLPKEKRIIFVPDKHLGDFVARKTGRDMLLWPGYCPTHVFITADDVKRRRQQFPNAIVLTHPECPEPVKELSDHMLSTGQMLAFVRRNNYKQYIIATEIGIIHSLKKENPEVEFIAAREKAICPNMKKISLEKVLWALQSMDETEKERSRFVVSVPEDIRQKAKKALDRMIEILPSN